MQRVKAIILTGAQQERQDEEEREAGQWRGPIPYMRLIMCLTQDYIKAAFLWRAWNSDVGHSTAFELIANKWNDEVPDIFLCPPLP
jgi:hypothetical protein